MPIHPVHIVLGLAVLPASSFALAETPSGALSIDRDAMPLRLAQNTDGAADTTGSPQVSPAGGALPDASSGVAAPPAPGPVTPSATKAAPAAAARAPAPQQTPALTGTMRNGPAASPGATQPGPAAQTSAATASIPFGGPQSAIGPAYGSSLRDADTGTGSGPLYSTAPTTLGGPINGTGSAYTATLPNGTLPNGYVSRESVTRGARSDDNAAGFTQAPLGGRPNTRDQSGTFGGRAGYDARGVYTGTAAQPGTGYGYGSAYATSGRPTGGLLGTNVDATGPLRPYVPLDGGPGAGRPNSGYGVPNGSRSTHMDARGVQRVD